MKTMQETNTVCVLTCESLDELKAQGGSQAWALNAKRIQNECCYVVCVQNRISDDSGQASAPRHTAFVVGRLKSVVRSQEFPDRWILLFSEYAEIAISDAWSGNRNPVWYTNLEQFGIKADELNFQPMPAPLPPPTPQIRPLSIAEAKAGLAQMYGVDLANIEITIRG